MLRRSVRPLERRTRAFRSLFGAVAGALLLTTAFAPRANAVCPDPGDPNCFVIVHWNFNSEINNQQPPYTAVEGPPATLFNDPAQSFPTGGLVVNSAAGTTVNQVDLEPAGGALDARGNTSGTGTNYCFDLGPINTSGLVDISLSFAILSAGNGQFTTLTLTFGTLSGGVFVAGAGGTGNIGMISDLPGLPDVYTQQKFTLPAGANNQSNLFIQFCFTGSTNNNVNNHTFIDNIQINAVIPEPATVTGGLLGVLGLCWHQRRRLIRCVRLRRT